ncbi:MAG: AEC family transporter [Candidatus Shapirobacteria bacterium]|nr:AEC family transporter [Candidatus Shapirobacteria bacterium]
MLINIAKLPLFWAIVLGLAFSLLKLSLSSFLLSGLSMVGVTASPVALFSLGIFLCLCLLKRRLFPSFILAGLKLIGLPLFMALIFAILGLDFRQPLVAVSLLQAAMPLAVTTFVLAQKYQLDQDLVANTIFISTLLSVIQVPIMISLLN